MVQNRTIEFQRIVRPLTSAIEFGANMGPNIHAIRKLLNPKNLKAIEVNSCAVNNLVKFGYEVKNISIFEYESKSTYEFALVC